MAVSTSEDFDWESIVITTRNGVKITKDDLSSSGRAKVMASLKKLPEKQQKYTAFMCFVMYNNPRLEKDNPEMSTIEIGNSLASTWRTCDEEVREHFQKKADKLNANTTKKVPSKPKAVHKKYTAYMCYTNQNQKVVKEKHPDLSFGQIGDILAKQWAALDIDSKQPYQKMADERNAAFSSTSEGKDEKVKKPKKKRDPNAPKSPMTPYMCFTNEMENSNKHGLTPTMKLVDRSHALAALWKILPQEEVNRYIDLSRNEIEKYKIEMAAYKSKIVA